MADAEAGVCDNGDLAGSGLAVGVVVDDDALEVAAGGRDDHDLAVGFAADGSGVLSVDPDESDCPVRGVVVVGDR